ncbi:MAG: hypothetical protein GF353_13500 [Candidatus Lokiarchaeota archaeon]|nr:hypothetical protein [Candidatus Lokiarchaeota archaeon]
MNSRQKEKNGHTDASKKILIVSENLEALKSARAYLSSEGYSIFTASTLDQATALCHNFSPALLIYDLDYSSEITEKILRVLRDFWE